MSDRPLNYDDFDPAIDAPSALGTMNYNPLLNYGEFLPPVAAEQRQTATLQAWADEAAIRGNAVEAQNAATQAKEKEAARQAAIRDLPPQLKLLASANKLTKEEEEFEEEQQKNPGMSRRRRSKGKGGNLYKTMNRRMRRARKSRRARQAF